MIREIINFTKNIDDKFKKLGSIPKEGLHIILNTVVVENTIKIDTYNYQYEIFSKKQKQRTSDFLNQCKLLQQNAWCIDTNKCFDLPTKAIHSCSPLCVAFKREHIIGGEKYNENKIKNKLQIDKRFEAYFEKAFELLENEDDRHKYEVFKLFFTQNDFSSILNEIEGINTVKREELQQQIDVLKEQAKSAKDKIEKEEYKNQIAKLENDAIAYKKLDDSDYIIFYLNVALEDYKKFHDKYLKDKLFVTDKYNTKPNDDGVIYGASNFMNTLNGNMPFLIHQTASFDITGRISNIEAQLLNEFQNILPNKTLPNPLPIFIYREELQQQMIGIYRENGFKFGYKEIIENLLKNYSKDLENYYLLYWANTKEGLVFKDFDFVSKFEYSLEAQIQNFFEIKEKDKKELKHYSKINNVFEFEGMVFKQLLQNKELKLNYFCDLSKKDYEKKDLTFISYSKFRKSVYDFVYKSQRQTVDGNMFNEMVFNNIKDNLKIFTTSKDKKEASNAEYEIKEILNIWYSLYDFFIPQNNINMASKLKNYQEFVDNITKGIPAKEDISDAEFAFAAGQVIYYIMEKSKSADNSYQLLEPYLQKAKCTELKQAIANDFARYKHENFSKNFERVASFVLSYETDANIKHLLPELLSGIFAKNQLFSNK